MTKAFKKALIIDLLLAALTSAIWIKFKSLSIADSIICFVVVFFVLFSIDTFSTWARYKALKKNNVK